MSAVDTDYSQVRVERRASDVNQAAKHTWLRLGAAVTALAVSTCAWPATIKMELNSSPEMCDRLLKMIKASGIDQMNDEQLCDFRLSSLPPSKTEGFTFPRWESFVVDDSAAMFEKMNKDNRAPTSVARPLDLKNLYDTAAQAARDNNLLFNKTRLSMDGHDVTFLSMDIRRCSKLPYIQALERPFYAAYWQNDMKTPIPMDIAIGDEQIALWNKKRPVLIYVANRWVLIGGAPATVTVTLGPIRLASYEPPKGYAITGGDLCSISIEK